MNDHITRQPVLAAVTVLSGLLTGILSISSAHAEPSIPIVPGKYEMVNDRGDTKITNCFPSKQLSAEVIRKQLQAEGGNEQCKIVDSRKDGNQLILDLACQYGGTEKGTGSMEISTSEETVTVKSEFRLMIEGRERSMAMTSVGTRIGGC